LCSLLQSLLQLLCAHIGAFLTLLSALLSLTLAPAGFVSAAVAEASVTRRSRLSISSPAFVTETILAEIGIADDGQSTSTSRTIRGSTRDHARKIGEAWNKQRVGRASR
jgi:hypothetical protein